MSNFTQPSSAVIERVLTRKLADTKGKASESTDSDAKGTCRASAEFLNLQKILDRTFGDKNKLEKALRRFLISGVQLTDLSIFCPRPVAQTETIDDIRLCICGVPIDIINAQYNPYATHPGGDADSGVFVKAPQRSDQLENEELQLIGRGRVNPLVGGISVGSVTGQAGTLGTIVWDRTDGTPCVLSNWHVLAGTATAQVDQPTYQPALFDGGTEDDVVARLKRWHLGEEGDAAIAELAGCRDYASGEILGLWHPITGYLPPKLNMEVRKWGRTTGFTRGFIDGIHLATNIDYGNGVVRYFKNQFHIAPIYASEDVSQVGDSGSLVVTCFRPIELEAQNAELKGQLSDLENDLKQVFSWLAQCCDSPSGRKLCNEIETGRTRLFRESGDEGCDDTYRNELKKALDSLRKACRKGTNYAALCDLIKKERQSLQACGDKDQRKEFHQKVDDTLSLWHEECSRIVSTRRLWEAVGRVRQDSSCNELRQLVRCIEGKLAPEDTSAKPRVAQDGALKAQFQQMFHEELEKVGFRPDSDLEGDDWFLHLLKLHLSRRELLEALVDQYLHEQKDQAERSTRRVYYAVGMIFAGDTPGSPFGEFAVASDVARLADELRFSLRPVFEPRSSFRELRVRPPGLRRERRALRSRRSLTPGAGGADPRGGGPQPDPERAQGDPD